MPKILPAILRLGASRGLESVPSEPDGELFSLDHFLGLQRLTHAYVGNAVLLGFDGAIYRIKRSVTPCPNQHTSYDYDPSKSAHSHFCRVERLAHVERLSEDDWNTTLLILEESALRFDRMVTIYRRPDQAIIYAVDETWGTSTSGKVVLEVGERETEEHNKFVARFERNGWDE